MPGFAILPLGATSRQSPGALGGNRGSTQPPTAPRSNRPPNSRSRQWRLTAGSPSGDGAQFTWRASMISRRPVVLSSFSHGFVLRMGGEGGHRVPERDGFVRRPPFPSRTFAYDASLLRSCDRAASSHSSSCSMSSVDDACDVWKRCHRNIPDNGSPVHRRYRRARIHTWDEPRSTHEDVWV